MELLSIKINTIFIPWYLASIRQVPARFHEKNNNLSILENGMPVQIGFSSCEILRSGIVPPNTLRKILDVLTVYNIHPQQHVYYMFSLKLHPVQRVSTFTFLSEACQWPYWAQNMFYLNSEALIFFLRGIFVVLKNNLNGFRDFYCGTKVGAGSPKVSSCIYVQGPGWTRTHTGTFA
jgi:hypothetical protein